MTSKTNMYAMFATDKALEADGIVVDYGQFRARIARAGGANQQFKKTFAQLSKPYRRQIDAESLSDEVGEKLMAEVYARSVVLGWETNVGTEDEPKWERVVVLPSGESVPTSPEAVAAVLLALPELFADIKAMAQKASNYQRAELEADAGN